jgi:YHS domain-containing protein
MKKSALVLFVFIFALSLNLTWAQDETNSKDVKKPEVTKPTVIQKTTDVTNPKNITNPVDAKTLQAINNSAVTKGTHKPVNSLCIVSGEKIDSKITADYKGKTYAFCCKTCLKKFTKDPEKYVLKYEKQSSKSKN